MCCLCWIIYQTRIQGDYLLQVLDSVVLGTVPKGPIRFLYYDNALTKCDWPYLPQGVVDPEHYAAVLLSNWKGNSSQPWEAIYAMPGISHARTNLACLLQEATLLGAVAVLPAVCLSPIHNTNHRLIRTHWSRYLYMDRLQQGFPIVWNVSLLEKQLQDNFPQYARLSYPLRWSCMYFFNNSNDPSYTWKALHSFPLSPKEKCPRIAVFSYKTPTRYLQQSKANILIREFSTNQEYSVCSQSCFKNHPKIDHVWSYFWSSAATDPLAAVKYIQSLESPTNAFWFFCLHLRRGDKLKEPRYPCLDKLTRGPHIYSVLRNASVPCGMKIYVLSNENSTQLDQLLLGWNRNDSCDYRWIYRQHIPYLQQSQYIQDNYLLYETEKRICQYAVGYVETHRTNSQFQHLEPWNLRLTPYEEECGEQEYSPQCNLNCSDYDW